MNQERGWINRNLYWVWLPFFIAIILIVATYSSIQQNDAFQKESKEYQNSMNSCSTLKQFILDHYMTFHYQEALARYGVMCK